MVASALAQKIPQLGPGKFHEIRTCVGKSGRFSLRGLPSEQMLDAQLLQPVKVWSWKLEVQLAIQNKKRDVARHASTQGRRGFVPGWLGGGPVEPWRLVRCFDGQKGVSLVGSEINLLPCKASNPGTIQVGSWLPVPLPPGVRCLAKIGECQPFGSSWRYFTCEKQITGIAETQTSTPTRNGPKIEKHRAIFSPWCRTIKHHVQSQLPVGIIPWKTERDLSVRW